MASSSDIGGLQSLVDKLSISGNEDAQDMDLLAEKIKDSLGIDLAPSHFRDLANQVYKLSLERRQHNGESEVSSAVNGKVSSSFGQSSISGSSAGGSERWASASDVGATSSFLAPSPTSTSFRAAHARGRSPLRQGGVSEKTAADRRSRTPIRSFLGSGRVLPASNRGQERRPRSQSPFAMFRSKQPAREESDEKKEVESALKSVFAPDRQLSGRQSPALDPSAEKPATPSRASSPMPSQRNSPPRPNPVRANNATATPRPRAASPYFRPGLQEDDGDKIFSQSPSRPLGAGHRRSNSFTPKRVKDADDDDESVQQPPTRSHRKSASSSSFEMATDFFGSLDIPELQDLRHQSQQQQQSAAARTTTAASDIGVETILTPPPQTTARPPTVGAPETVVKTGKGKMRRKDSTPDSFSFASFPAANPSQDNNPILRPNARSTTFAVPEVSAGSGFQASNVEFNVGTAKPPGRRRHNPFRKPGQSTTTATSTESFPNHIHAMNNQQSQHNVHSATSPPIANTHQERAFSPMDVDEFSPAPVSMQPPAVNHDLPSFNIGVASRGLGRRKDHSSRNGGSYKPPKSLKPSPIYASGSPGSATEATALSTPSTLASAPQEPELTAEELENKKRMEFVDSLRNEARSLYVAQDFRGSIHTYTQAIKLFDDAPVNQTNDTLAVLLSNRAACLVMLGAYAAAQSDCEVGLNYVSEGPGSSESVSGDRGVLLKVKLLTRLARARLKQGDHMGALDSFERAISASTNADSVISSLPHHVREQFVGALDQTESEAEIGKLEAERLGQLFAEILERTVRGSLNDRRNSTEALGKVNMALSAAGGSAKLLKQKVTLLSNMKRWREAAGFCERLAASHVAFDGVFVGDLEHKNPHPGVPEARFLTTSFFADATDEETVDGELKLNSKAAAEAILRLPFTMASQYLRALRLEERYPAAEAAIQSLEEFVRRTPSVRSEFLWLPKERSKLERTKAERERGDELFRLGDFDLAAGQYGSCLLIDGDSASTAKGNAGGRLHAVLHCNRAACLMAVRRFHEAIDECTAALRIHSRYMKAMLRRSRCYVRLHRYQEAISEYKGWLDLVEEARKAPKSASSFTTPCLFDGPKDVSDADVAQVKRELEEVTNSKRRAESSARENANRRRERQTWRDKFSQSTWDDNASTSSAHERRDQWYNRDNDSRRWDSFSGRRPRGAGHNRSKSWGDEKKNNKKSEVGSPGSDLSVDHYRVLEIQQSASDEEIKKKYRRLALQYHPDKNKTEGAADKFRRIKLAYETLSDPAARRRYDSELRLSSRRF